jgi:hypothetical protein
MFFFHWVLIVVDTGSQITQRLRTSSMRQVIRNMTPTSPSNGSNRHTNPRISNTQFMMILTVITPT